MEGITALEISPDTLHPGRRVNVRWLGEWVEGTVISLGPQKNLCKVADSETGQRVLLDPSLLKTIDSNLPLHLQLEPGANVAFYNNDKEEWANGVIEDNNAEGSVLIQWQRDAHSNATKSWFCLQDLPSFIQNEVNNLKKSANNDNSDNKIKAAPSLVDVLEERHRHTVNEVYQESPTDREPYFNKLPPLESTTPNYAMRRHRTSVSMKHMYTSRKQPSKESPNSKSSSLSRPQRSVQNQYALLRGKLDYSHRPAVWSYGNRTSGIPHHPTSKFFLNMTRSSQPMFLPSSPSLASPSPFVEHSPTGTVHAQVRRSQSDRLLRAHQPTGFFSDVQSERGLFIDRPILRSAFSGPINTHQGNSPLRPLPVPPTINEYEVPIITHGVPHQQSGHIYDEIGTSEEMAGDTKAPCIESSSPSEITVFVGKSTILSCQVSSTNIPSFKWTKDGKPISKNDDRVAFPDAGMLQLYSITKQQAGTYKCTATNDAGSVTYTCQLTVEEGTPSAEFGGEPTESMPSRSDANETEQTDVAVPMIVVEEASSQSDLNESKPVKAKKKLIPIKKKKSHIKESPGNKSMSNDMDQYLTGYGEDYGALSTQSDIMLSPEEEEDLDREAVRQLRFSPQRRISRESIEDQLPKCKSDSTIDDNHEAHSNKEVFKLVKLKRLEREVKKSKSNGAHTAEETMAQESNEQVDIEETEEEKRLRAASVDSMDGHLSYGSGESKSDSEQESSGRVSLPLAEQHYTEGIMRLQLAKEAYEEEHFGKPKRKKSGLLGFFSSKKEKKDKRVSFKN